MSFSTKVLKADISSQRSGVCRPLHGDRGAEPADRSGGRRHDERTHERAPVADAEKASGVRTLAVRGGALTVGLEPLLQRLANGMTSRHLEEMEDVDLQRLTERCGAGTTRRLRALEARARRAEAEVSRAMRRAKGARRREIGAPRKRKEPEASRPTVPGYEFSAKTARPAPMEVGGWPAEEEPPISGSRPRVPMVRRI